MISFEVSGIAVPQARAKATTIGGHARMYTPKKSNDYRALLRLAAQQAWGNNTPSENTAELSVFVVLPAPSNLKRSAKNMIERGEYIPKITRPDADNYLKQVSDAVNGVIVKDDSQFWRVTCRKVFGYRPRIEVSITFDGDRQ